MEATEQERVIVFRAMRSKQLVVQGLLKSPYYDVILEASQGNRTVEAVILHISTLGDPFSSWEKVGKAIGNLKALKEIKLILDFIPQRVPDWHTLSYVLSFLRHKIKLRFGHNYRRWNEFEVLHFATTIRHNPFIKAIEQGGGIIPTSCF